MTVVKQLGDVAGTWGEREMLLPHGMFFAMLPRVCARYDKAACNIDEQMNGHVEAPESWSCSATTGSDSVSLYIALKERRQPGD